MNISGMVKSSLVDYQGLISCVLFVPGCNYNCFYCHNRSLIDGTHDILNLQYVTDFLKKRIGLLDALVISGGEPTLQEELIPFLMELKEYGYKIKLDTNGSSPKIIASLLQLGLCDYFAVDYKAPSARYEEICGSNVDFNNVIETINTLLVSDASFEVRTTVVPQLKKEDLVLMAKELPPLPRYVLNRYQIPKKYLFKDKLLVEEKPYTQNEIASLAAYLHQYQPNTIT